jgi:iron complex transport system ATP-binding protein
MICLSVRGLSARLDRRMILNDLSFDAYPGVTMLLGPNGCGKSTVLRSLAGIIPCQGAALMDGVDILTLSAPARTRKIAYLPQRQAWDTQMSAREYVSLGAGVSGGIFSPPDKKAQARADETMEKIGITALARRPMRTLSGGEARLAGIARALSQNGQFMLLDEPLAGLDFKRSHEVLDILRSSGRNAVITIHDPALAWQYGHRVLLMAEGKIISAGEPGSEAAFERELQAVYGKNLSFTSVHGRLLPMWRDI